MAKIPLLHFPPTILKEQENKISRLSNYIGYYDITNEKWKYLKTNKDVKPINGAIFNAITWNIWFGELAAYIRANHLGKFIELYNPDFITLQEVTPVVLKYLLNYQPWTKMYYVSDITGDTIEPYGNVLFSRYPPASIETIDLPSRLGRSVIIATYNVNADKKLALCTSHLESYPDDFEKRSRQVDYILNLTKDYNYVIFMGDTNIQLETEDFMPQSKSLTDMWLILHPDNPGFTMIDKITAMTGETTIKRNARIDRILYKTLEESYIMPIAIERLGENEVFTSEHPYGLPSFPKGIDLYISDHLGLTCIFKINTTTRVEYDQYIEKIEDAYGSYESQVSYESLGGYPPIVSTLSLRLPILPSSVLLPTLSPSPTLSPRLPTPPTLPMLPTLPLSPSSSQFPQFPRTLSLSPPKPSSISAHSFSTLPSLPIPSLSTSSRLSSLPALPGSPTFPPRPPHSTSPITSTTSLAALLSPRANLSSFSSSNNSSVIS